MYMGETEGVGVFVPTLFGGTLSSALNVEQKQGLVRGASQIKIRLNLQHRFRFEVEQIIMFLRMGFKKTRLFIHICFF